jgi:hypothetical protein
MSGNQKQKMCAVLEWGIAIGFGLIVFFACAKANAQEQYIRQCANQPACTLTPVGGVSWAAPVQTYLWTPIAPNVSLRIWVHNNNTTSAHTLQTMTLWITNSTRADVSLIGQSDIWVQATISDNVLSGARCLNVNANNSTTPGASGMGVCASTSVFAAQMALQFTPGGAQAGAPDTFDLGLVQQPSTFPGGSSPGATDVGGVNFRTGANFSTGSTVTARQLNCFDATSALIVSCMPVVGLGMTSSVGKGLAASINAASGAGTDTLSVGNRLIGLGTGAGVASFETASELTSSTATQSATPGSSQAGVALVASPANWTVATQATTASQCVASLALQAAARHCATGVTACVSDTAAQVQLFVNLRDGATGAGTIKWNALLDGVVGSSSCVVHEFSGGPICGTIGTAMTLELGAATAANNGCTTTVKGYDIQ